MGMDARISEKHLGVEASDLVDGTSSKPFALIVEEDGLFARRGLALFEIGVESLDGAVANGGHSLFVAFAKNSEPAFVEVEFVNVEAHELTYAQAASIENLENCAVTIW